MASAAAQNLRRDRRCRVAPFERRMKKPRWHCVRRRQRTEPKVQPLPFGYACSSWALPKAQDVSDDVIALFIAELEIWHRGVRRLKPHFQRHGVHARSVGDHGEAWRLCLGRGALPIAYRVAFRTNGLRKN